MEHIAFSSKDQRFSIIAGFFIGVLCLPVIKTAWPHLYDVLSILAIPFFLLSVPFGLFIARKISAKIPFIWQVAKFGVIGVLNTFVDLGALSLLIFLMNTSMGIDQTVPVIAGVTFFSYYTLSKSLSFLFANINSYYWNKYWTFENYTARKTSSEFMQFFTVSIIGFIVNVSVSSAIFSLFHPVLGFSVGQWGLIGALSGTLSGLLWNFVGYKFIVFKK